MKRLNLFMAILAITAVNICSYGQKLIPHEGPNGLIGFADEAGNMIISSVYHDAGEFSEGLARVRFKNRWGYIDEKGEQVIPLIYNVVEDFSEGLARVRYGNRWGFIDKTGAIRIPFIYDNLGRFSEGMVRVRLKDKWGFLDKTGREAIPFRFENVFDFNDGLASVFHNNRWGVINRDGVIVVPFIYASRIEAERSENAAAAKLAEAQKDYSNEISSTSIPFQDTQNISTETYKHPAIVFSKQAYFGFGMGLDYGGFGAKLELLPAKHFGLFAGLGYNLLSAGWNIGATIKIAPDQTVSFNPMIFYGYNAVIKVKGASDYNMTSHGVTIGSNLDIKTGRRGNKFSIGLFVPIRSQEFKDHYDAMKKDPRIKFENELMPVLVSFGFNF